MKTMVGNFREPGFCSVSLSRLRKYRVPYHWSLSRCGGWKPHRQELRVIVELNDPLRSLPLLGLYHCNSCCVHPKGRGGGVGIIMTPMCGLAEVPA